LKALGVGAIDLELDAVLDSAPLHDVIGLLVKSSRVEDKDPRIGVDFQEHVDQCNILGAEAAR